jgi:signal recognition particle receptor subunit beta
MAVVNHAKKEINAKIVYFGSAGSAKNAALRFIYSRIKPALRGELKHVPAGGDTLLLFDFSPFDAPLADGYRLRLHVYTLSGPVANPATWKMTLKGCDGIVILVDADQERLSEAQASVAQLREFLSAYGVGLSDIATVLQFDGSGTEPPAPYVARLASVLDLSGLPRCTSVTSSGQGVLETLSTLSRLVLERIRNDLAPVESAEPKVEQDELQQQPPVLWPEQHSSGHDQLASGAEAKCDHEEPESRPRLVAAIPELSENGTVIRIPLELICGTGSRRLVVSVAVTTDTIDLYTPS